MKCLIFFNDADDFRRASRIQVMFFVTIDYLHKVYICPRRSFEDNLNHIYVTLTKVRRKPRKLRMVRWRSGSSPGTLSFLIPDAFLYSFVCTNFPLIFIFIQDAYNTTRYFDQFACVKTSPYAPECTVIVSIYEEMTKLSYLRVRLKNGKTI